MTPDEQDHAIELLRAMEAEGAAADELDEMSATLARGYYAMALSAASCCRAYYQRRGLGQGPERFVERQLESWRCYLRSAAAARGPRRYPPVAGARRLLFAGWHFPEHPAWLALARAWDWVIVVGRRSQRTQSQLNPGSLVDFREEGLGLGLARAFQQGRPVFGMFDFCYEDSHAVSSDFLGAPALTPSGLLRLGERFGYETCVVSGRGDEGLLLERFELGGVSVQAAADRINRAIEGEVLADPPRWLLWGAVERRWAGAAARAAGRSPDVPRTPPGPAFS